MSRLRAILREHRELGLLLVLFASFRWFVLLAYRPGGYILDFSDYYFYRSFAQLTHQGLYPYVNLWTAYPPLFPYLMIGVYRLSALLPAWNGTGFWFYTFLGTVLLAFESGNLVLVYGIGRQLGGQKLALRSAIFYSLLFIPVYTLTGWFESMPLFFFLLALYLLVRQREGWSAVATGLGFMSKLFPVLLLPLGLRAIWERQQSRWPRVARYLGLFAATVLAIALPFVIMDPQLVLAPLMTQDSRLPWESVWALWEGQLSYGIVHADMRDLSNVGGPSVDSPIPWGIVTLVFGLAFAFIYTRRAPWKTPPAQVAFAGLCTIGLLIYSKGYSPQFAVWVLPFICWLLPGFRGAAYAVLLTALNFLEANVYFIMFPGQHQFLVATVVLRTLLLLALAGEFALVLFPRLAERFGTWRRWATAGLLAASLAAAVILTPGLVRAYFADQLNRNPCAASIARLQEESPGAAAVFTDQRTFDLFYPYVRRQVSCHVLSDFARDRTLNEALDERISHLGTSRNRLWLVTQGQADGSELEETARQVLQDRLLPLGDESPDGCRLESFLDSNILRPVGGPATLGDVAELQGFWMPESIPASGNLTLLLLWEPMGTSDVPLTVFTHLVGEDGRTLAGHDGRPGDGAVSTAEWTIGAEVVDAHPITLPDELSAGTYRVEVGLYDPATSERLPVLDDAGQVAADAVLLGQITRP